MSPRWVRVALLAGIAYFLIGRLFPNPADHARAWRLGAWLLSGVVFALHIGYEHVGLRSAPRIAAAHVAAAVALGAFLLAAAGMMRSLSATSTVRPIWILSLVLWPAITAIPAYLVALVVLLVLLGLSRRGVRISNYRGEP